jgi:hypothetical protein
MATGTRVTVTTTATRLTPKPADFGPSASVAIYNRGASDLDIGAATVTAGAGFRLAPGDGVTLHVDSGEDLFGIVAAGTCETHVLRTEGD